jgi:S-adenosylmethionine:diacylglycerol 3-amino-3-carboxypropyl transferase
MFERLFRGLVYTQIWEDPEIDLEALALGPDCHVVAIASGGCNVMSYLAADPASIRAVDLNPARVALLKLKLAAARHPPHHEAFRSFFADAGTTEKLRLYREFIAPRLDPAVRAWWDGRDRAGRRRIGMFRRNLYSHGSWAGRSSSATRSAGCTARGRSASSTRATSPSSGGCSSTSWRRCSGAAWCAGSPTCPRPTSASGFRPRSSTP